MCRNIIEIDSNYVNSYYLDLHYYFFLGYAKLAGIEIKLVNNDEYIKTPEYATAWFPCRINGKLVIIDFSDFWNWSIPQLNAKYLKFQSTDKTEIPCVPLGPPIVGQKGDKNKASLEEYFELKQKFQYTPGEVILSQQIPGGNAKERRILVQTLLKNNFSKVETFGKMNQLDFWNAHENCLVAVCVPGATENMVDRGQLELIGLGVPTVSPTLTTRFVDDCLLQPDIHYIKCRDDYSDLVDIISSVMNDPDYLITIGNNAKEFFNQHYTPEKYWKWILKNIDE